MFKFLNILIKVSIYSPSYPMIKAMQDKGKDKQTLKNIVK